MVDGGYYGLSLGHKPQRPYTLWMMADYGAAPAAVDAYNRTRCREVPRQPVPLRLGPQEVLRLDVVRSGATWKIVSTEKVPDGGWQRVPAPGLAVSPDGMSLYICDWNYGGWMAKASRRAAWSSDVYGRREHGHGEPAWYVPAATRSSI